MESEPKRILFLNSRSEYGGADMGLLTIVQNLDQRRFTPVVVLPHPGPLVGELEAAGARVIYLNLCRLERLAGLRDIWEFGRRFLSSTTQLMRLIRQEHIALVYTNSSAIPVGALAARLSKIPNVWHIREIWTSPRWLTRSLYRYIALTADRIITITYAVAVANFRDVGGKIRVIYDGVDRRRFENLDQRAAGVRRQFGLTEPWPIVASVARMVPQKGLDTLVEAAHRLNGAGIRAYFCLAGDIPRTMYQSYKDALCRRIQAHHLEDMVRLLGWIEDVPALLAASDVVVLASAGPEGAGLIIPEAWLAGTPVVVPNHSGPQELVRHGETGLHFRAGDADDLARQIETLLTDKEMRERLAQAGREVARTRHDAQRNTARVESVLDELLGPGGKPADD
ncbi:MAG: glycosyltransferase [Anaerolineae bacterium]